MSTRRISFSIAVLLLLVPVVGTSVVTAGESRPAGEPAPLVLEAGVAGDIVPRASASTGVAAPLACPPAPAGLPDSIERIEFCVYYDSADTTLAQATTLADHIDNYWDRYVTDYGFPAPTYTDKFEVWLEDHGAYCNGFAAVGADHIAVYEGCDEWDELYQYVAGHELYHEVQLSTGILASPNFDALWLHEGTARSMEDKAFANVDTWADCLLPPFSYCNEVNNYLASTNNDITSDPMRYKSALWWTYYAEQCGSDPPGEPGLGVADSFDELWTAALTHDNIAALNVALSALGCSNWHAMFPQFVVTNYTKDLTGLPDASYYYADEQQAGNPAVYGPLSPHDGGTIDIGTAATWSNQHIRRYGADYFIAAPDPVDCPIVTAAFHNDDGGPAFYHIVTQNSGVFNTHVQGSGTDWSQSFLNDGITEIMASVGSLNTSSQVDIELSCADPVLDIKLPNTMAPEYVGAAASPGKFVAQVLVTNGAPDAPVVAGLTNADFKAEVGGVPALVVGGGFVQEQYFLQIQAPTQAANGPYDLEIFLEEPGTTNVIATDLEVQAVVYDASSTDHVLIIDRSGSMGWPAADPPLIAARDAANLFIDVMNSSEGLAMVAYNHDIDPLPLDMDFATLPHRTDAETFVNGLTPGGATSIGDGLDEAVNQRTGSLTGNSRCLFTLLSDGMENSSLFWTDVQTDVIATGCPVMSIAFGPYSNEMLMQDIAAATGGAFFYNDVYVSARALAPSYTPEDMSLDLGSTYEYAQARNEGRQRLLAEKGQVTQGMSATHAVTVDTTVSEVLFTLDWVQVRSAVMELELRQPDGTIIDSSTTPYDFEDTISRHVGWRIANPDPGRWEMIVKHVSGESPISYQVLASGKSNLTAVLLLPDRVGVSHLATNQAANVIQQWGDVYFTGNQVPIYALLSSDQPIPDATLEAIVTAPDGTETTVPLADDGEHGDNAAGDGLYAGFYTLVNQANEMPPPPVESVPEPTPEDEGAYRVHLLASHAGFKREALGSFAVLEGADADDDGLPDAFEEEHDVSDPLGDPDLDQLTNADEYSAGTDPNDSDTDGGGENDGSEASLHGLDPLDPSDDEIEAPDFVHTTPLSNSVRLSYDVKGEYAQMSAYRATSPDGPWQLHITELSSTGVETDTNNVTNGTTYYYQLLAVDGDNHWSALIKSEGVTPSSDPVPPEATVIIDDNAPSTVDLDVTLTFGPYLDGDPAAFDDIVEMKLSNDPSLAGAEWQTFTQGVAWRLASTTTPGMPAHAYARFRDDASNESVGTEVGSILYDPIAIYLPLIWK